MDCQPRSLCVAFAPVVSNALGTSSRLSTCAIAPLHICPCKPGPWRSIQQTTSSNTNSPMPTCPACFRFGLDPLASAANQGSLGIIISSAVYGSGLLYETRVIQEDELHGPSPPASLPPGSSFSRHCVIERVPASASSGLSIDWQTACMEALVPYNINQAVLQTWNDRLPR